MQRIIRFFIAALVFGSGVVAGAMLRPALAAAQDRFGPEEVNVPESFLKGGDRSVAVLQEMKGIMQEQTGLLREISANTRQP